MPAIGKALIRLLQPSLPKTPERDIVRYLDEQRRELERFANQLDAKLKEIEAKLP